MANLETPVAVRGSSFIATSRLQSRHEQEKSVKGEEMGLAAHPTLMKDIDESTAPMVYVVDDDESLRISLGGLLSSVGLRVKTFASTEEFLAVLKADVPSCLVLDVRLHRQSGLAFHAKLVSHNVQIPVVFMTAHGDVGMAVKAMKDGALDFLTKPFREQDMLDAVENALARDKERLATERSVAALRACYDSLTARELEVLGFVVAGLRNKQIATEMNLSEITVKVHRARVMKKMTTGSVADLVRTTETLGIKLDRQSSSR
jgi:FixJ family two-component response regulator